VRLDQETRQRSGGPDAGEHVSLLRTVSVPRRTINQQAARTITRKVTIEG